MSTSHAAAMKQRLRADLVPAMKAGRRAEAALIRDLIAALDNAEAAPASTEAITESMRDFRSGAAEVQRLDLDAAQVRAILLGEIEQRMLAAAEFDRLGNDAAASVLQEQAAFVQRYLD